MIPFLGATAAGVFAIALLFSGLASSTTAGMTGGCITSGYAKERYDTHDRHTTIGILVAILGGLLIIFFVKDAFMSLIISQIILSIQLPITIISQLVLTSSKKVMGEHANTFAINSVLIIIAIIVIAFNLILFFEILQNILKA